MNLAAKKFLTNTNWSWTETDCNKISFYKDDTNKFDVVSSSVSSPYTFTRTTAQNKIAPGKYKVQSFLTVNGEDTFVEQTVIVILPNISFDSSLGEWETRYNYLKTAYDTLCQTPTSSISVDGKTIQYEDRQKLLAALNYAEQRMKEETGEVSRGPKNYQVRFY